MTLAMHDLLIHYDEERGELIFYGVPSKDTGGLRANSFGGLRPEVSLFQGMPAHEAEQALGRLVFSLIDLNATKKIAIRDYKAEADVAHVEHVVELEEKARAGDVEAQYHLALEMHRSALNNYSLADLSRAESLLMSAAAQDFEKAKKTAESWPDLRAAAERRISRGKPV
jgi:hypothetical protein